MMRIYFVFVMPIMLGIACLFGIVGQLLKPDSSINTMSFAKG